MSNRIALTLAGLISLIPVGLAGQSYNDERWERFIFLHTGRSAIPEDEEIGALAESRNPDAAWSRGIEVCDAVFDAAEEGRVPSDLFYPPASGPLNHAFGELVSKGGRKAVRRYGLPRREGNRITVAVRVEGPEQPSTGYVYLIQSDQEWYVEQWAVDLSQLPVEAVEDQLREEPGDEELTEEAGDGFPEEGVGQIPQEPPPGL